MTHSPDFEMIETCLSLWKGLPPRDASEVMRGWCDKGRGSWTVPGAAPGGMPATHLHEVALYGVTASGESPEEAARNWLRAAQNIREASARAA